MSVKGYNFLLPVLSFFSVAAQTWQIKTIINKARSLFIVQDFTGCLYVGQVPGIFTECYGTSGNAHRAQAHNQSETSDVRKCDDTNYLVAKKCYELKYVQCAL